MAAFAIFEKPFYINRVIIDIILIIRPTSWQVLANGREVASDTTSQAKCLWCLQKPHPLQSKVKILQKYRWVRIARFILKKPFEWVAHTLFIITYYSLLVNSRNLSVYPFKYAWANSEKKYRITKKNWRISSSTKNYFPLKNIY